MEANAILREALADAQERNDVMEANAILMDAFWTDVRPGLAALREERSLPADPFSALRASGYEEKAAVARVGGNQMGGGAGTGPSQTATRRHARRSMR